MSWLHATATRLKLLFARRASEARIDRELQFHVDMETEHLVRDLELEPDEARRRALASFGGLERHREALRDGRGASSIRGMSLDLRLGVRMLVKYPGLALVGVLGMAVAVVIGTLAFAAVNAVAATSLPVPDGDRVVAIRNIDALENDDAEATILHDLETWRTGLTTVVELSAYRILPSNLVVGDAAPLATRAAEITASGFRLTRVAPVLGRYLIESDERPGAPDVAVIGHDVWQARFGGRPDVSGSVVQLGATRYAVIGVMPPGYAFPVNNDVWIPLRLDPLRYARGEAPGVAAFGRLAPGASIGDAQLELTTISQRLSRSYPETHEHVRSRVFPYTTSFLDSRGIQGLLYLGQVVVSLLLVVIGINVAVLVYARTGSRTGEISVRTALGASRRRIVMQLFAEALVLASAASVVGIVVARFVFERVESMVRLSADGQMPYWIVLRLSPSVILYVAGMTILAAVIIGVIPGLKATRQNLSESMKGSSGRGSIQLGRSWTALLVTQVAISVAALPIAIGGTKEMLGMALREFSTPASESFVVATPLLNAEREGPGQAATDARNRRYAARVQELAKRLRELPGGGQVVFMSHAPSAEDQVPLSAERVVGAPAADTLPGSAGWYTPISLVDGDFFRSFDIRILAGRNFLPEDFVEGAPAAIVNRSFATRFFGRGTALGRRFREEPRGEATTKGPWREIVGVVDDFPPGANAEALEPKVYLPLRPMAVYPLTLGIRAPGMTPPEMADRIRQVAMTVDPDLRFVAIPTMKAMMEQEAAPARLALLGIVMVALSVVLLSTAGIYALMSFTVTRRQREIGIRSALGASRRRVLAGVLSRAFKQVGLGIAIGTAGMAFLSQLLGESSPVSQQLIWLVQILLLMVGVSLVATIGPARRALRVQPTEALRAE